jgi:hypothetical protein
MMRQTVFMEQKIIKGSRWLLLKHPANLVAARNEHRRLQTQNHGDSFGKVRISRMNHIFSIG